MLKTVPVSVQLPRDNHHRPQQNLNCSIQPYQLRNDQPESVPIQPTSLDDQDRYLLTSPYTTPSHLLDLRTLSTQQSLLARALTTLQAVRPDYATAPYHLSFNWDIVLSNLRNLVFHSSSIWIYEQSFYVVVFRSRIPPTTSRAELGVLDERSHEEANLSGGLLKYWFGEPDGEGRNLATCVWRRSEDARLGGGGPGHKAAAKATRDLYTEWKIERLRIVVEARVEGWRIEEWVD